MNIKTQKLAENIIDARVEYDAAQMRASKANRLATEVGSELNKLEMELNTAMSQEHVTSCAFVHEEYVLLARRTSKGVSYPLEIEVLVETISGSLP